MVHKYHLPGVFSKKKDILLLMLKYHISTLMIFNVFSQYCINTDLYIKKKPSISSEY